MNFQFRNRLSEEGAKKLLDLFGKLSEQDQKTLVDLAEFLVARRGDQETKTIPEPDMIPRPKEESVVKAIKRLSTTYFMLDKSEVLNETSSLMAQHIMQGRSASEVIDELEVIFKTHYQRLREDAE